MNFFKSLINSSILPLSLLILIEHIGYGIFYPILGPVFMDPTGIMGAAASSLTRSFWYNLTLTLFPIAVFIGAPILGGISDQFGRKKVLMICLFGTLVSYLLAAIAIDFAWLPLLLFSRVVGGLTAGCMPIAQAAIIDLSHPEDKASNLGLIIFAASLGFIFGPFIGGFFSNAEIFSYFSYSTPFYVAAFLALLNMMLLGVWFKESFVVSGKLKLDWMRCVDLCLAPLKMHSIRYLSLIFFIFQLGWSFYFQFISLYLIKYYEYSSQDIALYMISMGLGFALGSCWGSRHLTKYFSDQTLIYASLLLGVLCILVVIFDLPYPLILLGALILGTTMAIIYALVLNLYSNLVSEQEQGWIMGVGESIVSIAWATTPLISSYLESIYLSLPLEVAVLAIIISFILFHFYSQKRLEKPASD